jgi:hypothetical protein
MECIMPRQNTRLQCEGAEFLVLGNLLIRGVPTYKNYTNMAGYDLVAINPDKNLSARIQVKSRWRTGADGFIISNFDCDFVVVALLNRGSKDGAASVLPPQCYVLPVGVAKALPRSSGWDKVSFSQCPSFVQYSERWELIRMFLKMSRE